MSEPSYGKVKTMHLDFYKADGVFYEGEIEYLSVPSIDGEYGVLADHENVVVAIVPGILHYRHPGEEIGYVAVSDGMMRIEDGKVFDRGENAFSGFVSDKVVLTEEHGESFHLMIVSLFSGK